MNTDKLKEVPGEIVSGAKKSVGRVVAPRMAARATAELPHRKPRLRALRKKPRWLLVVLDACRYDMLSDVFDDLFYGRLEQTRGNARDTFEWGQLCWDSAHPDVTYCSGATPICSGKHDGFDANGLEELYEGWRPAEHIGRIIDVWDEHWQQSIGTCPPEAVTNVALDEMQDRQQVVAHYFQPHSPYIGKTELLGHHRGRSGLPQQGPPVDRPIWQRVDDGAISDAELRSAYRANLHRALEAVCLLIRQSDNRPTVLMADHGEALGEHEVYAHPRIDHPEILRVPVGRIDSLTEQGQRWADRADDRDLDGKTVKADQAERLEDLGYL